MKKHILFATAALLLGGLTSCEDWLELPSESKADSGSVFETVSRAEMTVVGGYTYMHHQELGYQFLMGTDESLSTESNSKYDVSNYNYTNTTSILSGTYTSMYKVIEYANVCIKGISGMNPSEADRAKVNGLLGEAYAQRAYAYWCLVRFYGDIPYSDSPASELTDFASGRTSRDEIYDHCIEDLQKAVELLPWASESYVSTTERFTRNSALGILARVALYAAGYSLRWDLNTYDPASLRIARRDDAGRVTQLYQIARDACKQVMDRGENKLVANYDQLFRDLANQTYNSETMLEYGMYGTQSQDVRTGYTNGFPTSGTSSVLGKGGSQMAASPTLWFEYDPADQRRDVSVCNYGLAAGSPDQYLLNAYIGMGVGKYRFNWKKERGSTDSRRDINWPLLRYPDVLLMYAEAENELNNGPTAEAVNALKQVRERAFRGDKAKAAQGIPSGKQEFLDFIIKERKLELSNEGLRKSDLLRWGIHYEHLMAEKEHIAQLCRREGQYANVPVYMAYKAQPTPTFSDKLIAIPTIDFTLADLPSLNLSEDELKTLNTTNDGKKGQLKIKLYEAADGTVYTSAPAGIEVTAVDYTLLNMFGLNSIKNKGTGMSVDDVNPTADNYYWTAKTNSWFVGSTSIYYGMTKNMTEIIPFHTTAIIQVNPGLAGQQHPAYQ